jgi:hypothetical protein
LRFYLYFSRIRQGRKEGERKRHTHTHTHRERERERERERKEADRDREKLRMAAVKKNTLLHVLKALKKDNKKINTFKPNKCDNFNEPNKFLETDKLMKLT